MSRHFKFKTADDLRAAAGRLGLELPLTDDWGHLAQPVDVAGRRIGNRLAVQPMEGCDGEPDGSPGELTLRRYARFGAGGAKLIWGEAAAVVSEGRANPRQLVADEPRIPGLASIVATARETHRAVWGRDDDLLVGLQLTHSGRYSTPRPIPAQRDPLLDPRTPGLAEVPLISDEELDRLQGRYVAAARCAERAGFDFVDLKQCHRYLLNELLAARSRSGKYGGSFENRTRFALDVVRRIRAEVPALMIASRLNVYDGLPFHKGADALGVPDAFTPAATSAWGTRADDPGAFDLDEPLRLIGLLREAGVALVNVTLGNPYASPHLLRPFEYAPPDGYETPEHPLIGVARHFAAAEAVQRAFPDLPVVGSGYSWLQAFVPHAGAANVREGRATIVGVGRGTLSQPDFARFILEGRPLDPKRTCRTFSDCTALMRAKDHPLGQFPTGCPPFDKEVYGPLLKEAEAKRAAH